MENAINDLNSEAWVLPASVRPVHCRGPVQRFSLLLESLVKGRLGLVSCLIILVRFCRPNVYQLPLNIISDWRKALEANIKL